MVQAHAQSILNQKDAAFDRFIDETTDDSQEHPMIVATHRLAAALDRLERRLREAYAPPGYEAQQQLMFFSQENEALRQERARLDAAIAQLQSRYEELRGVASAIYGKLDDSVKSISQIIEK